MDAKILNMHTPCVNSVSLKNPRNFLCRPKHEPSITMTSRAYKVKRAGSFAL
jgi:hypothetical protein